MTETTQPQSAPRPAVVEEDRAFVDLLKSLLGKLITIVNPESYEDAPVGHQIRAGFYRAKPIGIGKDYLIIATEYIHKGKDTTKESVRQYIPFRRIKRISVMKSEKVLHI